LVLKFLIVTEYSNFCIRKQPCFVWTRR